MNNPITQVNLTLDEITLLRVGVQLALQTGVAKSSGHDFRFVNLNNKLTNIIKDEQYYWDQLVDLIATEVIDEDLKG